LLALLGHARKVWQSIQIFRPNETIMRLTKRPTRSGKACPTFSHADAAHGTLSGESRGSSRISIRAASSSTRPRFVSHKIARAAARVASKLNDELELLWRGLTEGRSKDELRRYDDVPRRARSLGFEYIENAELLMLPPEQRLERLETLVTREMFASNIHSVWHHCTLASL
jgi:hypothetical protein